MYDCSKIKELLVLYCEHVLDESLAAEIRSHLQACPGCNREAAEIEEVRRRLLDPELFAPRPDYKWQLLPSALAARARTARLTGRWLPWNSGSPVWTLTMTATIVLACGSIWLANRTAPAPVTTPVSAPMAAAPGNEAFLHRMQTAYAREATAQYLRECQDLLLTLMRSGKKCQGENYDVAFEVERAQRLIQRKQLLDSELRSPDVASANPSAMSWRTFSLTSRPQHLARAPTRCGGWRATFKNSSFC